jgi:hypothetical protein
MQINCLTESGLGLNQIYENCCGTIECEISLLPGETFREIHRLRYSDPCGGQILSVNGMPYADPLTTHFTITDDPDTNLKFVIQLCGCGGSGNTFQGVLDIVCQNPNFTETKFFDFEEIKFYNSVDINPINWFPCKNDCEELQPGFIQIQNDSDIFYNYEVAFTDCGWCGGSSIMKWYVNGIEQTLPAPGFPQILVIPPNQVSQIAWTECGGCSAPSPATGCSVSIFLCGETWDIPVTIYPVQCGDCGLNCLETTISTEEWNPFILPQKTGYCELVAGQVYDLGAIGEKKYIYWELQYDNGFTGNDIDIFFNPWMFDVVCNVGSKYGSGNVDDPPPAGWHIKFQPAMMGGSFSMTLYGAGVNANAQKNSSATAYFLTTDVIGILFETYLIEDIDNWVDTTPLANQPKLLNNHKFAPTPFQNVVQSVYNVDKTLCATFYIIDPNVPVAIPGSGDPNATPPIPPTYVPFECGLVKTIPFTARFYNSGLYGGASEFTNPVFTFERNAVNVGNLSTISNTKAKFKITSVPGFAITDCVFWLIDASNVNDFTDFVDNYGGGVLPTPSRVLVFNWPFVMNIGGNFTGPSQQLQVVGPDTYEGFVHIDTNLNPNGQYYLIAIPYAYGVPMVNSFITGPIPVTQIPGIEACCPMNVQSNWNDYFNSNNGLCFQPTMKERIQQHMTIGPGSGAGSWYQCLIDYGWNPAIMAWTDFLKEIRLNVYRRALNWPTATQHTWFIFDQYQSIRQVGFPGDMNNLTPGLTCQISGGNILLDWEGRVRYEDTIPLSGSNVYLSPSTQPFNRTPAGALGSTYVSTQGITWDWADQDIWFEYQFKFDLSSLFPQPCFLNQMVIGKIHPLDFETNPLPGTQWLKPLVIQGVNGTNPPETITGPFCEGTYDHLIVQVGNLLSVNLNGRMIAFFDPFPYGVGSLLEDEEWVSPQGMIQLDASPIYDNPGTYLNGGSFKVNLVGIPPGKYQLCGLVIVP